jgi:hypothetical protein
MKLLILSLLFLSSIANAASLDAMLGVGMGKSVLDKRAFERYATLGVRYGNEWKVQANGGYWLALNEGESKSLYGSMQGGVEVVGDGGLFASIMFGPAIIQNPDAKLSGHFQFHLTPGVGVKSDSGYELFFTWHHFSNAGLAKDKNGKMLPNFGRDLLTLQLAIPIYDWNKL